MKETNENDTTEAEDDASNIRRSGRAKKEISYKSKYIKNQSQIVLMTSFFCRLLYCREE
jgi:hypothetical protein